MGRGGGAIILNDGEDCSDTEPMDYYSGPALGRWALEIAHFGVGAALVQVVAFLSQLRTAVSPSFDRQGYSVGLLVVQLQNYLLDSPFAVLFPLKMHSRKLETSCKGWRPRRRFP
jgi:hypothetical protein